MANEGPQEQPKVPVRINEEGTYIVGGSPASEPESPTSPAAPGIKIGPAQVIQANVIGGTTEPSSATSTQDLPDAKIIKGG